MCVVCLTINGVVDCFARYDDMMQLYREVSSVYGGLRFSTNYLWARQR